jgi:rubrerythrin
VDKKIAKLRSLCQLDVDAVGAYEAAIRRVSNHEVRSKLIEFQDDHRRHVRHLNERITQLGGRIVEEKPDIKGALLKGFTAMTSMAGNEGALLAMLGNEELTTHSYQAALKLDWTVEEKQLIERHYEDERRHLAWVKQAAKERRWAQEADAHP